MYSRLARSIAATEGCKKERSVQDDKKMLLSPSDVPRGTATNSTKDGSKMPSPSVKGVLHAASTSNPAATNDCKDKLVYLGQSSRKDKKWKFGPRLTK